MAERELHDQAETEDGELTESEMDQSQEDSSPSAQAEDQAEGQAESEPQAQAADTAEAGDEAEEDSDKSNESDEDPDEDDDEYGISMDKVEAVLNADVDQKHMTPQMRRIVQRQEENSRRVEETIKKTRANPRWFVPLFITLMVLGLIWIVVYYLAATMGHSSFPIPKIGQWNLLVGFGILLAGFLMTMWWR